eukprot:3416271-Amphidinium_carterae.2
MTNTCTKIEAMLDGKIAALGNKLLGLIGQSSAVGTALVAQQRRSSQTFPSSAGVNLWLVPYFMARHDSNSLDTATLSNRAFVGSVAQSLQVHDATHCEDDSVSTTLQPRATGARRWKVLLQQPLRDDRHDLSSAVSDTGFSPKPSAASSSRSSIPSIPRFSDTSSALLRLLVLLLCLVNCLLLPPLLDLLSRNTLTLVAAASARPSRPGSSHLSVAGDIETTIVRPAKRHFAVPRNAELHSAGVQLDPNIC